MKKVAPPLGSFGVPEASTELEPTHIAYRLELRWAVVVSGKLPLEHRKRRSHQ